MKKPMGYGKETEGGKSDMKKDAKMMLAKKMAGKKVKGKMK